MNDLSKTSRVPRAKLYEVLDSLNRKGLIDVLPETPQRFRANPVSALYDTRVEELRAEEAELKRTIGELMVQLVAGSGERRDPEREFVHVLHGRTHFAVLARHLVDAARSSLVLVGDKLVLPRLRFHEELTTALARATARVDVRILVPDQAVDHVEGRRVSLDELEATMRRAAWTGGDALLIVRDAQEWLVVRFQPPDLHPSRGNDHVEVGRDPEIAALWAQLASEAWERGVPWSSAPANRAATP